MQVTVSYLLSIEKVLRNRMNELKELRESVSKSTYYTSREEKEVPMYDVKKVDAKISKLHKVLLSIDQKIKFTNATTSVELDINTDDLLSEIE